MNLSPPCSGLTELFVPQSTRHEELLLEQVEQCATVCLACPLRRPCAQRGIEHNDRNSIRAGEATWTEEGRERLTLIAKGVLR